ncbi:MAG: MarR family transcriptional regulator [Desulfobulbaceae bacterium]
MEENSISVQAFSALRKSACALRYEVYGKISAGELTVRQFAVLEGLHRTGPATVGELAGEIALSAATVGRLVAGLEKRNLVVRKRDAEGRSVVALTTAGGEFINTLFPVHRQLVEKVMGRLTEAEQENLNRLCRRFMRPGGGT